jgi:hypothetical protein
MAKSIIVTAVVLCSVLLFGAFVPNDIKAGAPGRIRVRQVYLSQVGVRERTGHNDGVQVEKYLGYCHLPKGSEWCSAFVSWCFGQAQIKTLRTGYSPAWYDKRRVIYRHGWAAPTQTPQPGDLVLYFINYKGRIGHVGFFDKYGEKYCETVEGNTTLGGLQGVHRIKRYWNSFYAIVDRIDN